MSTHAASTDPTSVRVAVVGCGAWGRNLVRTFHTLGSLVAVHDSNPVAASAAASEHGVPSRSFSELLHDATVDALVIAAPAAEHAGLARAALDADKDILVEKPLSLRVADAEGICELAERRRRVLMVGHLLQYHSAFQALEAMVRGGHLGRLQYMYSSRLNFGRIRREENILWSFAPHDISMMLRLAMSEPDAVSAMGSPFLHRDIFDVTTTHLSFPDGIQGHVFVSWLHPYKEQKLVVIGDHGMAVFDDGQPWDSKLLHYPHEVAWRDGIPEAAKANAIPLSVEPVEPLVRECEHFLACVAARTTPRTDGREALRVLRVLDAAERSMSSSGPAAPVTSGQRSATQGAMIHQTAIVDEPCYIGPGTKIWHFSHVLAGSRIGSDCILGQNVMVGPNVTIGDRCKIQNNVSVYEGVTFEDGVFCGPSAVFTNVRTPRAETDRKNEFQSTLVGRGATIGANATIVCGHTIGAYSLIAAGAVVTRDVKPHSLMMGVPARRVGWVSHDGERLGDDLVCPRSGRRYRETAAETLEEVGEVDPCPPPTHRSEPVKLVDLGAQQKRLGAGIERAIGRVLDHQQFIMGPEVMQLEERLASFCGAEHAVTCASGTDALLLPLLARGVGPGQAVLLPSFTFAASAEVVALLGATPVFVDVDDDTANLDPAGVEQAVVAAERQGLRPVAVLAVDLYGRPADYPAIERVAGDHGLWVIADAAQSFGATLDGRPVGTFGVATATSFFPSKPLGCYGDGGAVLTDDGELADRMRSLRLHGRGSHKYEAVRIGVNSRLDTIQAAVLLAKLDVLADELERRQRVAECYAKGLADVVRLPSVGADVRSAWALYTLRVDARDEIARRLRADGIQTAVYYPAGLHQQPAYQRCPRPLAGLPVTEVLADQVLSLPMHPDLTDEDQENVVAAVRRALGE